MRGEQQRTKQNNMEKPIYNAEEEQKINAEIETTRNITTIEADISKAFDKSMTTSNAEAMKSFVIELRNFNKVLSIQHLRTICNIDKAVLSRKIKNFLNKTNPKIEIGHRITDTETRFFNLLYFN